jgi:predicted homoserine dehydrogenase-like protein
MTIDPNVFGNPSQNMSIYSLLQMREAAQRPIRVGVVVPGRRRRAVALLQLGTPVPGIRRRIANRTPAHAERAFREAAIRTASAGRRAGSIR